MTSPQPSQPLTEKKPPLCHPGIAASSAYFDLRSTPIGSIRIFAAASGLTRIQISPPKLPPAPASACLPEVERLLREAASQLERYLAGSLRVFNLPVDLSPLTPFQRRVLEECCRIPYGQTASYNDLAVRLASPGAARAVGGALKRNPFPLVIPCHRVIAANGRLGGFSAGEGLDTKLLLLSIEGVRIVA